MNEPPTSDVLSLPVSSEDVDRSLVLDAVVAPVVEPPDDAPSEEVVPLDAEDVEPPGPVPFSLAEPQATHNENINNQRTTQASPALVPVNRSFPRTHRTRVGGRRSNAKPSKQPAPAMTSRWTQPAG